MPGSGAEAVSGTLARLRVHVRSGRRQLHPGRGGAMHVNPLSGRKRPATALCAICAAVLLSLSACGSSKKDTSSDSGGSAKSSDTSSGGGSSTSSTTASKCGLGNNKPASGTPVKLGAIVTKQPGTDFTDITGGAKAYFDCVNANGGINGRPVSYLVETEQTDPGQIASLAKKLAETEKVVAIVGNISLIECSVDHKYWEAKGYKEIDAGIAPECWSTPNSAPVNMGPRYSSDGAVQTLIRKGVKKIAFIQSN